MERERESVQSVSRAVKREGGIKLKCDTCGPVRYLGDEFLGDDGGWDDGLRLAAQEARAPVPPGPDHPGLSARVPGSSGGPPRRAAAPSIFP